MAERTKVFIAYCFPEKRWLDRVQTALEPFAAGERCVVWDERKVRSTVAWKNELPTVLASTKVAMMIVSDLFLESDFITRVKLPALLDREREHGLEICWVLAGQCLFELAGLRESDLGNRAGSAFDGLGLAQRDAEVAAIARKVAGLLGVAASQPTGVPPPKKQLLPSAIPLVLEPKPVPKKRRSFGAKKGDAENAPQPSLLASTPGPVAPALEPVFEPVEKSPAEIPPSAAKLSEIIPPVEPVPVPAPVESARPLPARELSLATMIEARQGTVVKLSQLGRWLLFLAYGVAFVALVVLFLESIEHFIFVAGFAVLVAGLALWIQALSRYLGQGLVAMRYTSSGLADEALPTRQRDALVRKADEYLAQN